MKKLSVIFLTSLLLFSCGRGEEGGGAKSTSTPLTSEGAKAKIDLELFLETFHNLDAALIGTPIAFRITLLNSKQSPIPLGKDWHRNFTISLEQYDISWKTHPFKYKVENHFDLESGELEKALTLLYSIETADLPPAKYKLGVKADAPTFFAEPKELIFELKRPTTPEEKTAELFYRASQEKNTQSILNIADDIIKLNESYFAYSVYLLKAKAHAQAIYESLGEYEKTKETTALQKAQDPMNLALSDYITFFSKNKLNVTDQDKTGWNDYFIGILTQYDVLEQLKGFIELELKP